MTAFEKWPVHYITFYYVSLQFFGITFLNINNVCTWVKGNMLTFIESQSTMHERKWYEIILFFSCKYDYKQLTLFVLRPVPALKLFGCWCYSDSKLCLPMPHKSPCRRARWLSRPGNAWWRQPGSLEWSSSLLCPLNRSRRWRTQHRVGPDMLRKNKWVMYMIYALYVRIVK